MPTCPSANTLNQCHTHSWLPARAVPEWDPRRPTHTVERLLLHEEPRLWVCRLAWRETAPTVKASRVPAPTATPLYGQAYLHTVKQFPTSELWEMIKWCAPYIHMCNVWQYAVLPHTFGDMVHIIEVGCWVHYTCIYLRYSVFWMLMYLSEQW